MLEPRDGDDHTVESDGPSNGGRDEEGNMMLLASGASNREHLDHDPTDWVSIRIGHSLSSLKVVANLKNVINDEFGEVNFFSKVFYYVGVGRGNRWERGGGVLNFCLP